ncbi:glucosamine-6-phosphate deaminase [Paenibacillus sp. TRM 82003]|uniref:glucosamine-6-phosphate deaminase n=1 Tax=Kineococcus sp. TRM81007 TaxID=2925831 RepID=UPI001F560DD7|nr:glucosamine-6-phosphate deaminase [Kineococcus sp. TRM81007]MCI2236930.1 glucosamine-6-phosphate deaminase [Kineococcus sp. TRM81007]MCI3921922.1 glucosamine-6-phosphate deaminase [Paenibacillus sp. TRM 82003]
MRIRVLQTTAQIGEAAADLVVEALRSRRDPLLGVATGSSPEPVYAALAARAAAGLDLGDVDVVALDEYVGLPPGHPESYRAVVRRSVVEPLGIDPSRVRVPHVDASGSGAGFEASLAERGGADVQLLGIGHNGHLAFNEPGSPLDSRTREVTLTGRTRHANARFFGGDPAAVPARAVTQGLATVLSAHRLVLVATGAAKAAAVAAALQGPVSTACPASVLQSHQDVTVLLDPAAAADLEHVGDSPREPGDLLTAGTG